MPIKAHSRALQNSLLALLHQTHAPFVVTVLVMVFIPERPSVAVTDALGRVSGCFLLAAGAAAPVGALGAGLLAGLYGLRVPLLVGAIVLVAALVRATPALPQDLRLSDPEPQAG